MNKDVFFDEYFDSIYNEANMLSKEEYEIHFKRFDEIYSKFLPEDKTIKILDVGSGGGHFLYYLNKKGYSNFYGIDISKQQIEFCKKKVTDKVKCIDVFDFLKDKNNEYDFIASHDVLEHIPKDKVIPLLKLFYASLKPKGQLLLRVPNMGNPFNLRGRYVDFTHNVGFTERSLRQVLWLGGFRNIQLYPWKTVGFLSRIVAGIIHFTLKKLMWYQGMVAPNILTPIFLGLARKED